MADREILACRKKIGKNIFLVYSTRINNRWQDIGQYSIFNLPADMPAKMNKLDLSRLNWKELPDLSSLTVKDFDCSHNNLLKLDYCPNVTGSFNCSYNPNLTDFDCVSQHVGTLICVACDSLESLMGAPTADNYIINYNKSLKNLNGMNLPAKKLICTHNDSLIDLTGISDCIDTLVVANNPSLIGLNCAHTSVGQFELIGNNALQSLNGGPKFVKKYIIRNNAALTSLYGAPTTVEEIVIENNPINNLLGGPTKATVYKLLHNSKLTGLMGCATDVEIFVMHHCDAIRTLEYAPLNAKRYECSRNPQLRSLGQILPNPELINYNDCPMVENAPKQLSHKEKCEQLRQAYIDNNQEYIKDFYTNRK